MALQWSASKTELLLQCARPFQEGIETPDNVEEPTRYGSAFHELCEVRSPHERDLLPVALKLEKKWDLPGAADELVPHVIAAKKCLYEWCSGKNDFGIKLDLKTALREAAFAVNPWKMSARRIELPTVEGHIYQGVERDEMPMTTDLMFPRIAVIDYKSGRDPLDFLTVPETHGQLLTLGLACAWAPAPEEAIKKSAFHQMGGGLVLAVLHAERGQPPIIHASLIDQEELEEHARDLQVAMHRAGDGSLREGACCRICPARHDCPARVGGLIEAAAEVMEGGTDLMAKLHHAEAVEVTADSIGKLSYFLRRFEKLKGPAEKLLRREYAKMNPRPDATPEEAAAATGEIVVCPDEKILVWKEKEVRSLSIKGVYEALGKVEGQALIEELEAKGVIKTRTQIELHAVDDD